MAKVELKQPIVEAISEELKGAQSDVLVDYRGLTVAQDTKSSEKQVLLTEYIRTL